MDLHRHPRVLRTTLTATEDRLLRPRTLLAALLATTALLLETTAATTLLLLLRRRPGRETTTLPPLFLLPRPDDTTTTDATTAVRLLPLPLLCPPLPAEGTPTTETVFLLLLRARPTEMTPLGATSTRPRRRPFLLSRPVGEATLLVATVLLCLSLLPFLLRWPGRTTTTAASELLPLVLTAEEGVRPLLTIGSPAGLRSEAGRSRRRSADTARLEGTEMRPGEEECPTSGTTGSDGGRPPHLGDDLDPTLTQPGTFALSTTSFCFPSFLIDSSLTA